MCTVCRRSQKSTGEASTQTYSPHELQASRTSKDCVLINAELRLPSCKSFRPGVCAIQTAGPILKTASEKTTTAVVETTTTTARPPDVPGSKKPRRRFVTKTRRPPHWVASTTSAIPWTRQSCDPAEGCMQT
ncbi:uncharacterized protein LOC142558036 [Dermacentor variabilis]|uniref:uncharacterized protein LOC142558036 n=1 Tax=Dermacentor variabilis TaxID=34621 RepID=UPI003F5B9B4A